MLAESLEQLYDDQFIETCAPWVAPYIGDLVGYRTLHGVVPQVASPRAEVANTIRYRRRKGTVSVLEQLAARRHRLARARGRVLRAARDDAVHEPRPRRTRPRPPTCATRRGSSWRERSRRARSTASRTPPRCAGIDVALGPLQHPATSASSSGACRRSGSRACRSSTPTAPACASASTRSARTSRSSTRRAPSRRSRTSPSRSTCRCRCGAASPSAHLAELYGAGRSLLLEVETAAGVDASPPPTSASATSPTIPPRPGAWAHAAAAGRHARRGRPRARPRRVRRRARGRRDAARDLPLRLGARRRRRRLRPRRDARAESNTRRDGLRRRPARPAAHVGRRAAARCRSSTADRTPRRRRSPRRRRRRTRRTATVVLRSRATATRPLLSRADQLKLAMDPDTTSC